MTSFYDDHPFDAIEGWDLAAIEKTHCDTFKRLVNRVAASSLVFDVGCGTGRGIIYAQAKGLQCIGIDRSIVSLQKMKSRSGCPGILADNMAIPIAGNIADLVLSDGVIHHTTRPDMSFKELVQVLKPGGYLYLAVYKPTGRYPVLFRFPGALIRVMARHRRLRPIVHGTFLLVYYVVHQVKSPGRYSWGGVKNMFYDYFVTPIVHFISRGEVETWACQNNMKIVEYDSGKGNVHVFVLKKTLGD